MTPASGCQLPGPTGRRRESRYFGGSGMFLSLHVLEEEPCARTEPDLPGLDPGSGAERSKCDVTREISVSSGRRESRARAVEGQEGREPLPLAPGEQHRCALGTGGTELSRCPELPAPPLHHCLRDSAPPRRSAAYWIATRHILTLPNSCRRQKTCFFPLLYVQEICTACSLHVITQR